MHTLSQRSRENIIHSTVEFLNKKKADFFRDPDTDNASNLLEENRQALAESIRGQFSAVRDISIINGQLTIGLYTDPKKVGEIKYLHVESSEWQKKLNPDLKAVLKSRTLVKSTLSSGLDEESIPFDMAS